MGSGLMGTYRKRSVEHQYALTRPAGKVAVLRYGPTGVGVNLLEDIDQRARNLNVGSNGEAESVGHTRAVVWILTEYYDLHLVKRAGVESRENLAGRRVDRAAGILFVDEARQLREIGLLPFRSQGLGPALVNSYFAQLGVCVKAD